MKKYRNNNFRVSSLEIIGIVVFFCLMAATSFFYKSYNDVKGLFNIGETEVDYIIQAPSVEQTSEISNLSHVDKIIPYYYRSVNVSARKGNVASTLFIIESEAEIDYTTFSKPLLIKTGSGSYQNPLFITEDFAKIANINVDETIEIPVDGTNVSFVVAGIYKSDYRRIGGSLLAINEGDVAVALKSNKYGGAFVGSNNLAESDAYFKNVYIPMGDLRLRDEFESEKAYQTYLETRDQSDSTKEAFITSDYIKELSRRNEGKLIRKIVFSVVCMVIAYLSMSLLLALRANDYTKTNVLRDIKDNFTIDQEVHMYIRYFVIVGLLMIFVNAVVGILGHLLGWINIISVVNIAGVCIPIVLLYFLGVFGIKKLEWTFLVENKKYEEELKKAEAMKGSGAVAQPLNGKQ